MSTIDIGTSKGLKNVPVNSTLQAKRESQLRDRLAVAIELFSHFDRRVSASIDVAIGTPIQPSQTVNGLVFNGYSVVILAKCTQGTTNESSVRSLLDNFALVDLFAIANLIPDLHAQCVVEQGKIELSDANDDQFFIDNLVGLNDFIRNNEPKRKSNKDIFTLDEEAAERIRKLLEGKDVPHTQDTPFIPTHWPRGIDPNKVYFLVDDKY